MTEEKPTPEELAALLAQTMIDMGARREGGFLVLDDKSNDIEFICKLWRKTAEELAELEGRLELMTQERDALKVALEALLREQTKDELDEAVGKARELLKQ